MHHDGQPLPHLLTSITTASVLCFAYLPIHSTIAAIHKMELCVKQHYENPKNPDMAFGSDFLALALLSDMFVDKTLLIKRLLEDTCPLLIITYPPKFGKSVNINMLKNFLELPLHANGTRISPIQNTFGYKLFKNGLISIPGYNYSERLYQPPLIADHKDILKHQGQYPVIFLDFEYFVEKLYSYSNIFDEICTTVSRAFLEHDYMIEVFRSIIRQNTTSKARRAVVEEQLNKFVNIVNKSVNEDEIIHSISFLSGILHSYFRKRVFILIDGYDSVFNKTMHIASGFPVCTLKDQILDIYAKLIRTTFQDNEHIEKGILTGILQINQNVLKLPSVKEYNVLNHGLHLYYGFTNREVVKLFNKVVVDDEYRDDVLKSFKYEWVPKMHIYNPWEIAHLIREKKVRNYWMKAVNTKFTGYDLMKYDQFLTICRDILKGQNRSFEHNHLQFDKTMIEEMFLDVQNSKSNPKTIDSILSYFVAIGYFIICPGTYNETEPTSLVTYANEEIKAQIAVDMLISEANKNNVPIQYQDASRDPLE